MTVYSQQYKNIYNCELSVNPEIVLLSYPLLSPDYLIDL